MDFSLCALCSLWWSFTSRQLRRPLDRADNPWISAAPAQVAVHPLADLRFAGLGVALEQRRRRDDHPARAVAALESSLLQKRLLCRVQRFTPRTAGQSLDRRDLLP